MTHEFVEYIPEKLEEGIIYISIRFDTVVHKCCCGCGNEVVTPLSPSDWELTFDGKSVSLYPSIGNWSSDCKSHYWIINNNVEWARQFTKREIKSVRLNNYFEKQEYYSANNNKITNKTFWKRIKHKFLNWLNI